MDFLPEYIKAWKRHNIHFGISGSAIKHLNIIEPPHSPQILIVEDECLVYRFRHSHRAKAKRGSVNGRFLNPGSLLRVLDGFPNGTIVILPIPEIYETENLSLNWLLDRLDPFLAALPSSYRYCIQLHNANYLFPDYYDCLSKHDVAHVMKDSPIFTTDFGVILEVASDAEIVFAVRQALEERKILYVYQDLALLRRLMELLNNDLRRLSLISGTAAA